MNTLRIPLAALAESPVLTLEIAADEAAIRPEGAAPAGLRDVRLSGVLSKIDTELYFEGTVAADLDVPCDRCLGPAHIRLEQPVEWFFEHGDDGLAAEIARGEIELELSDDALDDVDGRTVRTHDGETVDLAPIVWEELILALPWKLLCREDCKGMCPQCGANLNEGACGCGGKTPGIGHPGLAKLKDLYPDLPGRVED